MENRSDDRLGYLITSVIDTLSYYGVVINNMEIDPEDKVKFSVTLLTKKLKRSVEDTLDITYWALWCLLYGEYTETKKDIEIILEYKENDLDSPGR